MTDDHDLTRQERRDIRRNKARFIPDNRRSVRLLAELGVRPLDSREKLKRRRSKGAKP